MKTVNVLVVKPFYTSLKVSRFFWGGVLIFVGSDGKYFFKSWSSRTKRNSTSLEFVVCVNTIMFHETIIQIPAMQNTVAKKTGNRSN